MQSVTQERNRLQNYNGPLKLAVGRWSAQLSARASSGPQKCAEIHKSAQPAATADRRSAQRATEMRSEPQGFAAAYLAIAYLKDAFICICKVQMNG